MLEITTEIVDMADSTVQAENQVKSVGTKRTGETGKSQGK